VKRKRPNRYHHGDLRNALIDASLATLREEGTAGLQLRAIARRVGVSQAAPYRHFSGREDLLATVATVGFERLRAFARAAADETGGDPMERMRALSTAYVRFAAKEPQLFRLMFGTEVPDKSGHADLLEAAQSMFELIADAVAEAQAAGSVRVGDPLTMALLAWSTMHGLAQLLIDGQLLLAGLGLEDADAVSRMVRAELERGLAPAAFGG
jgi:AcrR family transcriptional regulator